jgi:hypothetical protein
MSVLICSNFIFVFHLLFLFWSSPVHPWITPITPPYPTAKKKKLSQIEMVLSSKAFNAAWNVQPESPNYNAHGCCVNHWYKVPVTVDPR